MASYYSLIAEAVAGLDPDAPAESRRALYERASAALLAQLRTINPPFTEAQITRERLALEEAVCKVEGEAAQRARDARIPAFSDLAADADDLGRAAAEASRRHSFLQAANSLEIGRMASPSSLNVEVPSMIVSGGATGRMTGIWRWIGRPRSSPHS
jgi:hypothetical protein